MRDTIVGLALRAARAAVALAAAAMLLPAPAPGAAPAHGRPVIVGINRDYPPYEYLDTGNRPAGFDVDLVRAVAEVEDIRVEFRAGVWEDLVRDFQRGDVDMLAGMLHSREREQFADFSSPHLVVHYSIFVRTSERAIRGQSDLRGRGVLVERGSQMHEFLRANPNGARIVPVESEPEALRRLAAGGGDAAIVPQLEGLVLAKQRALAVRQVGGPVLTRELCFAVRKDAPELLSRLNTGLAVLNQTGRYATLYKRSFGAPPDEFTFRRYVPWTLGALGALLLALVSVALWNRSLGRQVAIATRQLREANAEIRRREQFLDTVIENLPVGVFVKDPRRNFALSLWNNRSEEMFGIPRPRALGHTDHDLFPPEQADAFLATDRELMERREPVESFEQPALSRSRGVRLLHTRKVPLLDERGEVALILGIAEDVTDRNAMESALREARRLEGLGVLAGGIAHDFNNLLTAILGNLGLVTEQLPSEHPSQPMLRTVETAALRAADLTRQMLAYAGKAALVVQPLDLNEVANEMVDLLRVSIPPSATLRRELAAELPAIQADPVQIHQVLLNLVTNSADALGDSPGQIVIATALETVTEDRRPALHPASPPIPPGRYVTLRVTDSGAGMSSETQARIFDPFFTTKFSGHGLGLSAILGILKTHGAGLAVESAPGHGSTFRLYFPAIAARPVHVDAPVPETPEVAPARHGTILLAEDLPSLRDSTARMLRQLGYEVIETADGRAALEAYQREPGGIQLVLTDLTMPGMNGLALARKIRAIGPDTRIVLMSGFPGGDTEDGRRAADLSGFLPKPFRLKELRDTIEKALRADT
jgi:two-component system sensor histidine kinase EvgS